MSKEIEKVIELLETQAKDLKSMQTFLTVAKIGNDEVLAKLRFGFEKPKENK